MLARNASRNVAILLVAVGSVLGRAEAARAQIDRHQGTAAGAVDAADPLPVSRITLYRSGVGFFERRGQVEGNAEVQLRFNTDQINDILKSMVLMDLGGGRVESVQYGSKEPLERRLGSFGVNIAGNPGLADLLNQLRGAPVKLLVAGASVQGTILGVENRLTPPSKDVPAVSVPHVNLVTDTGLRSLAITEVSSFEILDKALAEELNKALAALAEYRADRSKTVDLRLAGTGSRTVVVGYVHEMPVWKTSYRLVLPEAGKEAASAGSGGTGGGAGSGASVPPASQRGEPITPGSEHRPLSGGPEARATQAGASREQGVIQGWAIVENTTDHDWNDVRLALVSGRPVSFRMDLYEPLFTFRPQVAVPTMAGVMPRSYAGGVDKDAATAVEQEAMAKAFRARGRGQNSVGLAAAPAAAADSRFAEVPEMDVRLALRSHASGGQSPFEDNEELTAEDLVNYSPAAAAAAGDVGELFRYELAAPVTVERQRSAMIPILSSNIDARRVSIYSLGDGAEHPMRGLELTNQTGLQLLPGPISVFDGASYAGDAQVGHVGTGDTRLLSYSVDLDVSVLTTAKTDTSVDHLRIVDGAFEQTTRTRGEVTYTFDNNDESRGRTLVIEHPRYEGYKLVEPKQAKEETKAGYRFEFEMGKDEAKTLKVAQERTERQTVGVTSIDLPTILAWHKDAKLSDKVLQAARDVAARQSAINTQERAVGELDRRVEEINQEQGRIRSNMGSIDRGSELYKRYMEKLTNQETQMETLREQRKAAGDKLEGMRQELNEFIRGLNVE